MWARAGEGFLECHMIKPAKQSLSKLEGGYMRAYYALFSNEYFHNIKFLKGYMDSGKVHVDPRTGTKVGEKSMMIVEPRPGLKGTKAL